MHDPDKPNRFALSGKKGGEATRRTKGLDHFSAIGQKGGAALLAARGREHFAAIGRLAAKRRAARNEEA